MRGKFFYAQNQIFVKMFKLMHKDNRVGGIWAVAVEDKDIEQTLTIPLHFNFVIIKNCNIDNLRIVGKCTVFVKESTIGIIDAHHSVSPIINIWRNSHVEEIYDCRNVRINMWDCCSLDRMVFTNKNNRRGTITGTSNNYVSDHLERIKVYLEEPGLEPWRVKTQVTHSDRNGMSRMYVGTIGPELRPSESGLDWDFDVSYPEDYGELDTIEDEDAEKHDSDLSLQIAKQYTIARYIEKANDASLEEMGKGKLYKICRNLHICPMPTINETAKKIRSKFEWILREYN